MEFFSFGRKKHKIKGIKELIKDERCEISLIKVAETSGNHQLEEVTGNSEEHTQTYTHKETTKNSMCWK